MLTLVLPFPPSVNSYWRNVGKTLLSKRARQYRESALACLRAQRGGRPPIAGPVIVNMFLCPPDGRRRDLDNYLKAVFDALTHAGVWTDDSLVRELHMAWGPPRRGGFMEIKIWSLADERPERIGGLKNDKKQLQGRQLRAD